MVTKGKVAKVRPGHKAHGKICGFKTSNGMPACNQADTTPYVMAYVDDLLVSRTHPYQWDCIAGPLWGLEWRKWGIYWP